MEKYISTKLQKALSLGILVLLILSVFLFLYRKQFPGTAEPISGTAFKLDTVVSVKIYDSTDPALIEEAFALCDKYEALFSRTIETSEIYRLNEGTLPKEGEAFLVSNETVRLVGKALEYAELSGGAFDPSIEPVSSLWDFTSDEKKTASKAELTEALPLVNYNDIVLTDHSICFQQEGMGLDLGAIAKGYIADRMKDYLVSKGVKSAIINLGGNVLCIGAKPDGTPFQVGIQKPFANRNETIGTVGITDGSVVSSGIYERFFEQNGEFYHHILNPETGMPFDNSLISVTILSRQSVDGDGLSTACFALGLEKGMELINRLPDVEAVFITKDNELHYSENFPQ